MAPPVMTGGTLKETLQRLEARVTAEEVPADAPFCLSGAVITQDGFLSDGWLVISGDRILQIGRGPAPVGIRRIDTGCIITPAYVDAHNHAPYAALPRWKAPSRTLKGRFDWRRKTRCGLIVVPEPDPYYAEYVAKPYKAVVAQPGRSLDLMLYGQIRGLIGGASTMLVDADVEPGVPGPPPSDPFVRDPSDWTAQVWGVLDVGCLTDARSAQIAQELAGGSRLLVHVAEGLDDFSRGEFLALEQKGLLTSGTALIHATALLWNDWARVASAGASVVWSPVSNLRLYGRTLDVGMILGHGISVALAPDWAITGSSTMQDELRFVRRHYPWLDPETLLGWATATPARLLGLPDLGDIASGKLADLILVRPDPACQVSDRRSAADAVVTANHTQHEAVLIAGRPVYGTPALVDQLLGLSRGADWEPIQVPARSGAVNRTLRIGGGYTFASVCQALGAALASANSALAPVWEDLSM